MIRKMAAAAKRELEITIPPFFTCPISLDLMKDPVSTCTGVTYDRASIEKWIDDGNATCPATLQPLVTRELIPNHTLRRLIQAWCGANAAKGVERVPTPKTPANSHTVRCLFREIQLGGSNGAGESRLRALRRLRALARDSVRNAICISDEGAADVLAGVLMDGIADRAACEEAVGILAVLPLDEVARKKVGQVSVLNAVVGLLAGDLEDTNAEAAKKKVGELPRDLDSSSSLKVGELKVNLEVGNMKASKKMAGENSVHLEASNVKMSKKKIGELEANNAKACKKKVGELIVSSTGLLAGNLEANNPDMAKKMVREIPSNLEHSNPEVSINAAELVERLMSDDRILSLMSAVDGLIPGLVFMIRDLAQPRAVKAAVRALAALCAAQKNRAKAVAAGIVDRLVAVLIEPDRGLDEACLCLLESLCRCAEGRAAVADHALAVPVIVKKMSRSSPLATEFAVGALWSVCGHCEDVGHYAAESGVCAKLFWLLQVDCTQKVKIKAGELIRLIHTTCRDCPCCYANACFENAGLLRED